MTNSVSLFGKTILVSSAVFLAGFGMVDSGHALQPRQAFLADGKLPYGTEVRQTTVFTDDFESSQLCAWSAIVGFDDFDDVETHATYLGEMDDCDGTGLGFSGILNGSDDVDFFRIWLNDVTLCTVDPVITMAPGAGFVICVYVECASGEAEIVFSSPAYADISSQGFPGLCIDDSVLAFEYTCTGAISEDADLWIKVGTTAPGCVSYSTAAHGK